MSAQADRLTPPASSGKHPLGGQVMTGADMRAGLLANRESPASSGMQYGITYIVRPRIAPVNRSVSSRFIRIGSSQLLVGPASSSVLEQIKV